MKIYKWLAVCMLALLGLTVSAFAADYMLQLRDCDGCTVDLVPTTALATGTVTPISTPTVTPTPTPTPTLTATPISTPTPTPVCTVAITAPDGGATVSGTVAVTVSDLNCPAAVFNRLYVGGKSYDVALGKAFVWDTTQSSNGPQTLGVIAWDSTGLKQLNPIVPGVTVTVANAATPTPTPTLTPTPISTPTVTPEGGGGVVGLAQPFGVAAPAGFHWALTFDDEFNGSNPNDGLWNGGYSTLPWCANGTCAADFSPLSMSGGNLIIQPIQSWPNTNNGIRGDENTNGKFSQRYGFFEWRAKFPHDDSGEGDGLWAVVYAFPVGKSSFPTNQCTEGNEEVDVAEHVMSTTDHHYVMSTVHDNCYNEWQIPTPAVDAGDLTQAFHQYQLWWKNDGTPHGTMCFYFDGINQGCHTLDANGSNHDLWDNGIYLINQMEPCPVNNQAWGGGAPCTAKTSNSDPFYIDYTRAWQLVAN